MRAPPRRGSITANKANSRLGLAALALAVAASIALGAGAVRVLTLPLAPKAELDPAATSVPASPAVASGPTAVPQDGAALAAPLKEQHSEQSDQNIGNDPRELSPAQAVSLVQRRYRAQVVRTKLQQDSSGRQLYVFRLLSATDRVWTVRIDAHSGAEVQ
jgi:hypothetical protein